MTGRWRVRRRHSGLRRPRRRQRCPLRRLCRCAGSPVPDPQQRDGRHRGQQRPDQHADLDVLVGIASETNASSPINNETVKPIPASSDSPTTSRQFRSLASGSRATFPTTKVARQIRSSERQQHPGDRGVDTGGVHQRPGHQRQRQQQMGRPHRRCTKSPKSANGISASPRYRKCTSGIEDGDDGDRQ